MRISDWSSDVCSSDLQNRAKLDGDLEAGACLAGEAQKLRCKNEVAGRRHRQKLGQPLQEPQEEDRQQRWLHRQSARGRSEEHMSELQSLMRISYAVFCLKKKKHTTHKHQPPQEV